MIWATPMLAGLVAAVLGGCSINTATLHTGLSPEEFNGRVREVYCIGMPMDEAESVSRGIGLRVTSQNLAVGDRPGMWVSRARIHPKGLFRTSFLGKGGPEWRSWLTLHFGDDFLLDKVTHASHPAPHTGIIVDSIAPRGIPLDDCDQTAEGQR